MPGDVDDVVDARHYEHVAVLVHEACITRAVVSRELLEIGRAKALLSIPQGRKRSGRKRQLAAERADVAGLHLVAIGTERTNVPSGNGFGRRARLHRERLAVAGIEPHTVRNDRPTCFGLPPMVDNGHAEPALRPLQRIGIAAFAGEEERAEFRDIVLADELTVGIVALDGTE